MTQTSPDHPPVDDQTSVPPDEAVDPWSWVDRAEGEAEVDLAGHRVTAVLVAMDAAVWLPQTLASLAAAHRRPDRLIAVDNASTDTTGELLAVAQAAGTIDQVVTCAGTVGFGAAVAVALEQAGTDADQPVTEWLWLLHDDILLRPDTLDRMLRRVAVDPEVAVSGPKLVRPRLAGRGGAGPAQLSEVGVSIAGTGRRELGLEPGEVDQGQHDEPRDVLAVSTCAMLVRRDAWDELGGLTGSLPVFRDGVDFGWRARLAGYRVMTSPAAAAVHRQVGRAGLRAAGPAARHPVRLDRALGLHVVQGHATGARRPLVWLRLVLGCLAMAVGYLMGKAPGRSVDELAALGSFVTHPGRTRGVRAGAGARSADPDLRAAVARLRPPWWSGFALGLDRAGLALTERGTERGAERAADRDPSSTSLDELTGDDYAGPPAQAPRWRSAVAVTVAAAVVLALVASRALFTAGRLSSIALLPTGSWTATWQAWLAPVPGSNVLPAPWLGWVAAGSTVLFGQPEWLITVLLCGMVPLAFAASCPLLTRLVPDRRVRWWGAATWAVLPPMMGGTTQGRLSLAVLAVALPLTGLAVHRLATRSGLRGAWATGLGLAVLAAFEPTILVPAAAAGVAAVLATRDPRLLGRSALALAVPLVLWSPWWVSLLRAGQPGRLLFGPDPALVPAGAIDVPATWALLLGRAGGPGLPPLWLSALVLAAVWLTALVGLAVAPGNRFVRAGWALGLLGLVTAVLVSRTVSAVSPLSIESRPWAGALLLLAFGGLVLAGATGMGRIFDLVATRSFGALQPLSVLAAVLLGAVSLAGAGWYVVAGGSGPLHRDQLAALPPYIRDAQVSDGVRTLAIAVDDDAASWSLVGDDQLRLGAAERGYAVGGSTVIQTELDDLTRRLVGGAADEDIARSLTGLGVQYLWVSGAPADQQIQIGNTPGLSEASGTPTARVWRVTQLTARALVAGPVDAADSRLVPLGSVARTGTYRGTGRLEPGPAGRTLVLTEAADPRWRATLDGVPLDPVGDPAGRPAFALPTAGGDLSWELSEPDTGWLVPLGQGVLLLILLVLALPALRPESRHPTTAARRAAGVETTPAATGGDR